jgi:hypothetical protein
MSEGGGDVPAKNLSVTKGYVSLATQLRIRFPIRSLATC